MSDSTPQPKKSLLHSGAGPLLWAILFAIVFTAALYLQKPTTLVINNETMKKIFTTYAVAAGPAYALLLMLGMYILAGIKRIVGLKNLRAANPIIVLLVTVPSVIFGWQLLFNEKPYTDIARGIIGTIAFPLLLSSAIVSVLAVLWLIVTLLRRS